MSNQSDQMKWILFWVFLTLFVITTLGTLGMVFFGFGTPTESERTLLVKGLIGEVAACVIALFYSIFGLRKDSGMSEEIEKLRDEINLIRSTSNGAGKLAVTVATSSETDSNICAASGSYKNETGLFVDKLEKIMEEFDVDPPFKIDEYAVKPSVLDIKSDIENTKPFDKEHRKNSYIGMKVQWKLLFYSISEGKDDGYRIAAYGCSTSPLIYFNIKKSRFQQFFRLNQNEPFWMCGIIHSVSSISIELEHVSVNFGN